MPDMEEVMASDKTKPVESLRYGNSLPVPSVQEIVRKDPAAIPVRYLRNDDEKLSSVEVVASTISDLMRIPVLNLKLLSRGDVEEKQKLDAACKSWGFFQVVNHGICHETLMSMRDAVVGFFDLPLTDKKQYAMLPNDLQGYGQVYVISEEQKLDWNDMLGLLTVPENSREFKYWPKEVPNFRSAIDAYSKEIVRVSRELLAGISFALGLEEEALLRLHGEMKQVARLNYYPPCCTPEKVMGISPHSDSSSMTVLWQEDDLYGLQIRHEGRWFPVVPIPGALVVNIGDVVEIWSNGLYKSVEHRAVVHAHRPRMSVATFVIPQEDLQIGPLDQLVRDHPPAMYKKVKYMDYLRSTFTRKMQGKANVDSVKVNS